MVNITSFAKFLMEVKFEYCLIDVLLGIVGERGSTILNVSICFYSEIFKMFFHNSRCVHPFSLQIYGSFNWKHSTWCVKSLFDDWKCRRVNKILNLFSSPNPICVSYQRVVDWIYSILQRKNLFKNKDNDKSVYPSITVGSRKYSIHWG